jgi:hypothetical protein
MNLKRTLAIATTALAMMGVAGTAFADGGAPTKADKVAAKAAGKYCDVLTDDITWEACNIGMLYEGTGRTVTADDYTDGAHQIILTHGTRSIRPTVHKVSGPDRLAMIDADASCRYIIGKGHKHVNMWIACQVGMFNMIRNRAITDADFHLVAHGNTYRMVLDHGSHHISGARMN